jgi:hypothetical protein
MGTRGELVWCGVVWYGNFYSFDSTLELELAAWI